MICHYSIKKKSYLVLVSNIYGVKLNLSVIVLNNELGETQKHSRPCVISSHKVFKLKNPEEHYFKLYALEK